MPLHPLVSCFSLGSLLTLHVVFAGTCRCSTRLCTRCNGQWCSRCWRSRRALQPALPLVSLACLCVLSAQVGDDCAVRTTAPGTTLPAHFQSYSTKTCQWLNKADLQRWSIPRMLSLINCLHCRTTFRRVRTLRASSGRRKATPAVQQVRSRHGNALRVLSCLLPAGVVPAQSDGAALLTYSEIQNMIEG